jgi:FMN reductase (NADPH)
MGENRTSETIEQIYQHGSIRKYKAEPVPIMMIEAIIAAAQRSSTSSNLQTYSVVAVTDRIKREELASLCGNQRHIRQAPVFLAWCADLSRLDRVCQIRGHTQVTTHVENFLVSAVDAAIAMQTATLAAESLGLGMCYIGAIRNNPEEVIKLLKLPRLLFPISGMTLGWPDTEVRYRPRLPLQEILHWEVYSTEGREEALHDYDKEMIATGIYKGRQVQVPDSEDEWEDLGWMEQSAKRASHSVRVDLRRNLFDQGFDLE